ncbi:MAG: hypothetical protein WC998_05210 [Candidatus Paceibacterota bacterium]|jgi:hypothetical protein
MLQKVHIKQNEKEPYKVEILVDGVNIANRICGYTLTQEPGGFPVFEVKSINLSFGFDGEAEVIDRTAHEEIERLKEQHKRDMENLNVLDEALRECQRKCMRADIERIF